MPGLANRAPTAQEHSPKRIAQSEAVLLPVGKCGGGALGSKDWSVKRKTGVNAGSVFLADKIAPTVAILAQGTHWAVAVTQAFLPRLDSHGPHFLDPFYPYGLGL